MSKFKLRPSTALAALALFAALGGGSYAIAKGSQINGSQLKNGSVAGKKLKKHTLTGTQIKVSSLPTVPSANHANSAGSATTAGTITGHITGSQVSSAVANATNATTAGTITGDITGSQVSSAVANATNATNATNASNVNGHTFTQINGSCSGSGAGNCSSTKATVLSDFGGLTLGLTCNGTSDAAIIGTGATGASLNISAIEYPSTANSHFAQDDLASGGVAEATTANATDTFVYRQTTGSILFSTTTVVTGTVNVFNSSGTCTAYGQAQASSSTFHILI